jgi:hypothetical protein
VDFPFPWQAERGLNVGVYLHDSTPANGCLHVVPRSHTVLHDMPALVEVSDTLRDYKTKIVQAGPKLWANFRDLIGIFNQSVGPSLAIWATPVQFR